MDELIDLFNQRLPNLTGVQIVQLMRDHGITIDQLPKLSNYPDKLEYVKNATAQQDELRQWLEIEPLIANPVLTNYDRFERFIAKWDGYQFAAGHIQSVKTAINSLLASKAQNDWELMSDSLTGPTDQSLSLLNNYINEYADKPYAAEYVAMANDRIRIINEQRIDINREDENRAWDALQFCNNIRDVVEHINYWNEKGINTHREAADELTWQIVQRSPEPMVALREYLTNFPNGRHMPEARASMTLYDRWMDIKGSRDLFRVVEFIAYNPNSAFVHEAIILKNELKEAEIKKMREMQDEYPGPLLLELINRGIFTKNELIGAEVITENSLQILKDLQIQRENLPDLIDIQENCETECTEGRTDIFLFGTPSTGKTCILMGLLGSHYLHPNYVEGAGNYAEALSLYLQNGFTPGQTVGGFVATIQASISDKEKRHDINLVELSGEDFITYIANKNNGTLDFSLMGNKASDLLNNSNRKVFFIIVDPTSKTLKHTRTIKRVDANGQLVLNEFGQPYIDERVEIVDQALTLSKLVNMLENPGNKKILDKVEAIHFIVTKSDKLGPEEKRSGKAKELFERRYRRVVEPLTELCRQHGINMHPNKRLNGVPSLFTFSLGQFYPGGIYEYDETDANVLVETIIKCTQAKRKPTVWDRFCDIMNRPII